MLHSKQNNPLYKADKNLLYTRDYFIESGLYLWRTSQVPSLVRFPSEDLNTRLWVIYDSRYSHQDYDSVLGGVHELSYSNININ